MKLSLLSPFLFIFSILPCVGILPAQEKEKAAESTNLKVKRDADTDKVMVVFDRNGAQIGVIDPRLPSRECKNYELLEVLNFMDGAIAGDLAQEVAKGSGMRIDCTIDAELQTEASKALERYLMALESSKEWNHSGKLDGAIVTIDNSNGAILTYIGGRDFNHEKPNRAVSLKRRAGALFIPFVYAAAFERAGMLPSTLISDAPIQLQLEDGVYWNPKNSDGTNQGEKTAEWGLSHSRNTMAVRVGQTAGLDKVRSLAKSLYMGEIPESPKSFLGEFDSSLMTMTSAYSTFASKGDNFTPYLIERIETGNGKVLYTNRVRRERILKQSTCENIDDVLQKSFNRVVAKSARGVIGSIDDKKNGWFIGYNDRVTTGVWIGTDDSQKVIRNGALSPLPVWLSVMKKSDEIGYRIRN